MKFLFYIFILLLSFFATNTTAQTESIVVGDTVAVFGGAIHTNNSDYFFYRTDGDSHSNPRFFTEGSYYYSVFFAPQKQGKEIDVHQRRYIYTRLVNNNREFKNFTFIDTIVANGIDSIVTSRINGRTGSSIMLMIDTPTMTYKDTSFMVSIYNNINDSTLYGSWSINSDSSLWFTVTADTNSTIVNNILLIPFTRKMNVRLRVSTTLRPTPKEKYIHCTLSTSVKNSSVDSILINTITVILPQYQVKDTIPPKQYSEGISVYPNPSTAGTTVIIAHKESGLVQLGIYDDLGRLVKTLGTNQYPGIVESFYIEDNSLPTGCYFVKEISTSGTKVQKLIIY